MEDYLINWIITEEPIQGEEHETDNTRYSGVAPDRSYSITGCGVREFRNNKTGCRGKRRVPGRARIFGYRGPDSQCIRQLSGGSGIGSQHLSYSSYRRFEIDWLHADPVPGLQRTIPGAGCICSIQSTIPVHDDIPGIVKRCISCSYSGLLKIIFHQTPDCYRSPVHLIVVWDLLESR
jgi:hypothetical protein